jgi:diguanylate cyclase (GGDEF)-like protein
LITWDFNPYSFALIATGILSLSLCMQLFLRWENRECALLGFALLFTSEWNFFEGFESAVQNPEIKILFAKFSYVGVFNCLPLFLLFVIHYFEFKQHITRFAIILLWTIPVVVIGLAATNEMHNLIWSGMTTPPDAPFGTLVYLRGPLYWLGVGYNYVLSLTMAVLLYLKYRKSRFSVYRNQALIICLSIIPPFLTNILYILRLPAFQYLDFTPFGFFLTGLMLFIGLTKFRLLEIAPIARDLLFDNLSDGIIVLDKNDCLADINVNGKTFLKIPEEDWKGVHILDGLINLPRLKTALGKQKDFLIESKSDAKTTMEIEGKKITKEDGSSTGWLIAIRDISTRKKMQKIETERRQFAEALRDVSLAINSTLNLDEVLERILSSIFELLPCNMANIVLIENGIGRVKSFHGYISEEEIEWVKAAAFKVMDIPNMKMMIETGKPMFITDTRLVDYFSNPNVLSYMGAPITVKDEVIGFLNLDSDKAKTFNSMDECDRLQAFADLAGIAIDNARMYQKMTESAVIDSLTGINNRRNLLSVAEKEFERAIRYKTSISIIMLDIDNFKLINDTCGHLAGDVVLSRVGKALTEFIRRIDIAGRYGGDEFCIILPETTLKDAGAAAQRLLDEFHKIEIPSIGFQNYLQASLGVACKDEKSTTLEELLAHADKAMYQAKKRGRNRVEIV